MFGGAPRVVVADDDAAVRSALTRGLAVEGYRVEAVSNGAEVVNAVGAAVPDAVILDVMMPVLDGVATCRTLRGDHPALPILMLTARVSIKDRVAGLDAGADDYLIKPFALVELTARMRALLRRTSVTGTAEVLTAGGIHLDSMARVARREGTPLVLSRLEFDLLEVLVANAGIVMTRDRLYDLLWGADVGYESRSLDVHVSSLRAKTEVGGLPRVIETVRGVGFVIRT